MSKTDLSLRSVPAVLALTLVLASAAAAPASETRPLAVVDGDTITTRDLAVELSLTGRSDHPGERPPTPEPDRVLKRLVQNRLLVEEGERLGLHEQATIVNPVRELIRSKSIVALVDSVAYTVPWIDDETELRRARLEAIREYIARLHETHAVTVDTVLLHSLDYASEDPQVQAELAGSDAVLAQLPGGALRVRSLTQNLRFKNFHGLAGRPDAAQKRDAFFWEWLDEALLTHEAGVRGFDRKPEVVEMARYHQEELVREATVNELADVDFKPSDAEVVAYHAEHAEHFTPDARIKAHIAVLVDQEAADLFVSRLRQGADFDWLVEHSVGMSPTETMIPDGWIRPRMIDLTPEEATLGRVSGPFEMPSGWMVAQVSDVEVPVLTPLEQCRPEVLKRMRNQSIVDAVADALDRLEAAADVVILPGALDAVRDGIAEWEARDES